MSEADESENFGCISMSPLGKQNQNALRLIAILEKESNWSTSESNSGGLEMCSERAARCFYSKIHQNAEQYFHFYNYFFLRFPTNEQLKKYTTLFQNWEYKIHDKYTDLNQRQLETLKCWRLHLGSTKLLKTVIESTLPPGKMARLKEKWNTCQNFTRSNRQTLLSGSCSQSCFQTTYNIFLRMFYALKPLYYSFLLYFETLKNLSFAYIIYMSMRDLQSSGKDDIGYETSLFGFLIGSIILTQLIFMWISHEYLLSLIPISKHWKMTKIILCRFSSLLGPIMPTFALSNYVLFSQKEYLLRRDLQRPIKSKDRVKHNGYNIKKDVESQGITNAKQYEEYCIGERNVEKNRKDPKTIYQKILHHQDHKILAAKFYSYFRIVSASIESYFAIVILIVIFTCDNGDPGSLSHAMSERMKYFLLIMRNPEEDLNSFTQHLHTARLCVFSMFILYSFLMTIFSLVNYVNVHKDEQMTWSSKLCLAIYFACHLVTRITLASALYVTPHLEEHLDDSKFISKMPASIFGVIFFFFHFLLIYWYKHQKIDEFQKADTLEKFIHVLVNTLVVIPFRPSRNSIIPKASHSKIYESHGLLSETNKTWQEDDYTCYVNIVSSECTNKIRLTNDNKKIEKMWWKNIDKDLTFENIQKMLPKRTDPNEVQKVKEYLCDNGYINKKFYCPPRPTKQEYFWLLLFHLLVNGLSLIIEWYNGGVTTKKGRYISWDIRLGSFVLGLIFLWLYYKRYHLVKFLSSAQKFRDRFKLFFIFICKEQGNVMKAIPNSLFEENENLNCSTLSGGVRFQSQTSMTVHVKIESMEDILCDEDDNSIIHVKGRLKHIDTNTNRKLLQSDGGNLQTTV